MSNDGSINALASHVDLAARLIAAQAARRGIDPPAEHAGDTIAARIAGLGIAVVSFS